MELNRDQKVAYDFETPEPPPEVVLKTTKSCPKCNLVVDTSVEKCPADGTELTTPLGDDASFKGKYEFLSTVGVGGMGVIYKARQVLLNKFVAIKTLHSHLQSEEAWRRFHLEGKAASSLRHQNIVAVHDFGVTEDAVPYMVMEFVEGKTLADLLEEQGTLSAEQFKKIFTAACAGIAHAHNHNVLHRDIKPSNIMLTKQDGDDEHVLLMDFGIAKVLSDSGTTSGALTQTGEAVGSPLYMSPEQARGDKIDRSSDLYSLGCVMYEALTGNPPFMGKSAIETVMMHATDKPVPPTATPTGEYSDHRFEKIVLKLLAKNPSERFQSAEELSSALNGNDAALNAVRVAPAVNGSLARNAGIWMLIALSGYLIYELVMGDLSHQNFGTSNHVVASKAARLENSARIFRDQKNYQSSNYDMKAAIKIEATEMHAALDHHDTRVAEDREFNIGVDWNLLGRNYVDLAELHRDDRRKYSKDLADAYDAYYHAAPYYYNRVRENYPLSPAPDFVKEYRMLLERVNKPEELAKLNAYQKKYNITEVSE